jgi:hypothetical protein
MLPRVSNPPRATSMRRPPPPPTRIHLPVVKTAMHKPVVGKHRLRCVRTFVLTGAAFTLLPLLAAAILSNMQDAAEITGYAAAPHVAEANVRLRPSEPIDAPATTPTNVDSDRNKTAVESQPAPRWTVGSTKAMVESIEGPPRSISRHPSFGEEWWCYGYEMRDKVTFALNTGTVIEWQNFSGNLQIGPAPSKSLTAGEPLPNRPAADAPQEQKERALAAIVDQPRADPAGEVDVPREEHPKRFWTYGSSKSVVEEIDGPPTSVNKYGALGYEEWRYNLFDTVKFGMPSGKVCEWNNLSGQLSVALAVDGKVAVPEPDASFGEGSSKEEVARAQGTPRSVANYAALGYVEWGYNMLDKVKFDVRTERVTEWDNYSGMLRLGWQRAAKR